jgi:nicotinamide-nucleotide amidase
VTSIDEKVAKLLRNSGLTLSVAESCSGGLIAKRITDVPGSSGYFLFGAVTYSNESKVKVLGVPGELLEKHGAVSSEVALAMAEGVRRISGSAIAIATTGIAGPDGGTPEKPVGTVFIAIVSADGGKTFLLRLEGDRNAVREATAEAALQLLLDRLSNP